MSRRLPDAVAFPETTDEVAAIVQSCAQARVPVIAFGMGSSLEGPRQRRARRRHDRL